jgi:oligopeptide transport system substrate-binding protein
LFQLLPQLGTYYLSFNDQKAPFDNPLVRKALTLAIDRVYISEVVRYGTFAPATAMVGTGFSDVADGSDFRKTGGDYFSLDFAANVELAKQALAEAGYPNGEGLPPIEYMYNISGSHQMVAEAIAKGWEDSLGVKVNLVQQEWNSFLDTRRKGNYEVARNGWVADWNDPSTMLTIFITGGGNNDSKYSNPQFDAFMAESYATTDRAARMTAMHNAEDVLMNDWGCAPVMYYALAYAVKPELKDWVSLNVGYTMFHYAYIEE